jgi:hypothetical protein
MDQPPRTRVRLDAGRQQLESHVQEGPDRTESRVEPTRRADPECTSITPRPDSREDREEL